MLDGGWQGEGGERSRFEETLSITDFYRVCFTDGLSLASSTIITLS